MAGNDMLKGSGDGENKNETLNFEDVEIWLEGGSESVFRSDVLGFARSGRVDWPEKTCKQWTVDG